ncbi:MAG: hypothetical protein ACYC8T_32405 [Myxococcaceae bacterium]
MQKTLDVVLLLALPASGKSEVRRYLSLLEPKRLREEMHLGEQVQLDDYPYVHLMRRVDQELKALGQPRVFFRSDDAPMLDGRDWGTLVQLVNEDFDDATHGRKPQPPSACDYLFSRMDKARGKVGLPAAFEKLAPQTRKALSAALEKDAKDALTAKNEAVPASLKGKSIVIEFARGGPDGSKMPLPDPLGYQYSLRQLSPELLSRAVALYIWVTPEESRRKNTARTDPNDPGSILHHGVPMEVMMKDYGCDDMAHLLDQSDRPGTLRVEAHGKVFNLPLARFDNRVDRTSFARDAKEKWPAAAAKTLHDGLAEALAKLAGR